MQVRFLDWKDPLDRTRQPIPIFLPRESHVQRSLAGYRSWDHNSQTRLSAILYLFIK